jgi:putative glycosyltransferase (TIGR04348 family)
VNRLNIVIVTPAFADANNGNWQTAKRWSQHLLQAYRVRLAADFSADFSADPTATAPGKDDALLIALHARRSAASVAAWKAQKPNTPVLLVMTGTDLYRDIQSDPQAQASLKSADCLVVLNEMGARALPADLQAKARVVLQSCSARQTLPKTQHHFRALMVGHLRDEKSPRTYFQAARFLVHRSDILLDHVGAALDPALGEEATALMAHCPSYRWLGGVTHAQSRQRIQAAHVLVHPSKMEGGAHVVMEAVRSGTPVLASRIDGNVGLLGENYDGYFPPGDAAALASVLQRLRDDAAMLAHLVQQCAVRSPLFDPTEEAKALHTVVHDLLTASRPCPKQHPPLNSSGPP